MARRVTISADMILDSALKMLISDGYQSINIKSLAREMGCSTQPIAWHFKNMEGLRKALAVHAKEYYQKKAAACSGSAIEKFEYMGQTYISTAMHEPNLFKFLFLGECPISKPFSPVDIAGSAEKDMINKISALTGLSAEQTAVCIRNTVFYSHGIASMIATGVFTADEAEIMAMIKSASESFVARERNEKNG